MAAVTKKFRFFNRKITITINDVNKKVRLSEDWITKNRKDKYSNQIIAQPFEMPIIAQNKHYKKSFHRNRNIPRVNFSGRIV